MSTSTAQRGWSTFDVLTFAISILSLLASLFAGSLIIPSTGGFYGGTAIFVSWIVFIQLLGMTLCFGLPGIALLFQRRFRLSRSVLVTLGLAILGIAAEIAALIWIPVTGVC